MDSLGSLGGVLAGEGLVGIRRGKGLPSWGGEELFESIQLADVAHGFPCVVGGVGVGWRPSDKEE